MIIPEELVTLMHGVVTVYIATRDNKFNPYAQTVLGLVVNEDRETITFYIPSHRSTRILNDLNDNGKIALSVNEPNSKSYQLKGSYISINPCTEKDTAIQDIYMDKLTGFLASINVSKERLATFIYKPGLAIKFKVEEIYDQTPGPDAGKRLV